MNRHRHNHRKDDADRFRESSLKAIRRRKLCVKITYYGLITLASIMVALVFAEYYIDK